MTHLEPEILRYAVEGVNLVPGTLADQIHRTTLLVFLRHFGCIFCREMVKDLRQIVNDLPGYPDVLFVFQGSVEDGKAFFAKYWPEARAIADLPRKLYDIFEIKRATFGQGFGPMVWSCAVRAGVKGNTIGLTNMIGDPWVMPGMFLIQTDGQIIWQHQFKHVGDHPDLKTIPC